MTWTPSNTFTPGQTGFASKLNTALASVASYADGLVAPAGQCCILNRATAQTGIVSGTLTTVTWDSEREDLPGWFSAGTPDRITVTSAGIYAVACQTSWDANNTGSRYVHLEKIENGATNQDILNGKSRAALDESTDNLYWQGRLNALTSVRVRVYQNSGANRTFGGYSRPTGNPPTVSANSEFSVVRIA